MKTMKTLAFACVALGAPMLFAATSSAHYWTGAAGSTWFKDLGNWDTVTVTGSTEGWYFTNGVVNKVSLASATGARLTTYDMFYVSNGTSIDIVPLGTSASARDCLYPNMRNTRPDAVSRITCTNDYVNLVGNIGGASNTGVPYSNNILTFRNCDVNGRGNAGSVTVGSSTYYNVTTNNWVVFENATNTNTGTWMTLTAYGRNSGVRVEGDCPMTGGRYGFYQGASMSVKPGSSLSFSTSSTMSLNNNITQEFDRVTFLQRQSVAINGTNVVYRAKDSLLAPWPVFAGTSSNNVAIITNCAGMAVQGSSGKNNYIYLTDCGVTNAGSGFLVGGAKCELVKTVMNGRDGHSAWGLAGASATEVAELVVGTGSTIADGGLCYFVCGGQRNKGSAAATNNVVTLKDGGRLLVANLYVGRSYSGLNKAEGSNNWVKAYSGARIGYGSAGSSYVEDAAKGVGMYFHGDGGLLLSGATTSANLGTGTIQTNAAVLVKDGATATFKGAITFDGNARLGFFGDDRGDTTASATFTFKGRSKLEFEPLTKAFEPAPLFKVASAAAEGNTVLIHGKTFQRNAGGWVTLATYQSNGSVPAFTLDPASQPKNIVLEVTETEIRAKIPRNGLAVIIR